MEEKAPPPGGNRGVIRLESYLDILLFAIVGLLFPVVTLVVSAILRPHRPNKEKLSTYECGELPYGDARVRFHIRYYLFALIFVVFDLETVFLYPWAVVFTKLGLFAFIEMMIFLGILFIGLIYAWKKKVLQWV